MSKRETLDRLAKLERAIEPFKPLRWARVVVRPGPNGPIKTNRRRVMETQEFGPARVLFDNLKRNGEKK
ncbi:MAG: hypothetical protein H7X92_02040 [Chitinophagales bacterium]|nr:hypothetical protein [Hyphomicrobiales bacterium]